MQRSVELSETASGQLVELADYISRRGSPQSARGYVARIVRFCDHLALAPYRGASHDSIRPGLRTVGFERRVTIAFTVEESSIRILLVLYGGRNVMRHLKKL